MRKKKRFEPITQEDKVFFQDFYEKNKNFMYYTARKYTTVADDCEDLVQETTIRLMNNISTLRQINRYKIAKYISLTVKSVYFDSEKIKQKDNLLFLDNADLEKIMIEQLNVTESNQTVAANIAINKLKHELPARDWIVLEGKYLLGLSQEEIGNLIGVIPDSVRMVLHRAREKAKLILESETVRGGD